MNILPIALLYYVAGIVYDFLTDTLQLCLVCSCYSASPVTSLIVDSDRALMCVACEDGQVTRQQKIDIQSCLLPCLLFVSLSCMT